MAPSWTALSCADQRADRRGGAGSCSLPLATLGDGPGSGWAGIQPALLDEAAWWQAYDLWWYALAAAVAVIRACADRMTLSVPTFVQQLSALWKITL